MKYIDLSVIIPCYRCANTIHRAIDSVLQQTVQPKEILLIEDFSDDGGATLSELAGIRDAHPSVLISVTSLKKNSGPGIARNIGWEMASGKYIAFLDADDAWHPKKLEIQFDFLNKRNDVDLCGHLSCFVSEIPVPSPQLTLENSNWRFLSLNEMLYSNYLPTRSIILKKAIPLRFGKGRNAEDYLLWMQIIASGFGAALIDLPLAYSFRPPFSRGGLSGQLWVHEKGELKVLHTLYLEKLINKASLALAVMWSLIKFIRRSCIRFIATFVNN